MSAHHHTPIAPGARPARPAGCLLWRAARDRRGLAVTEFALTLPILMAIFLGIIEFGEVYTADRRLSLAANTAADLVARNKTISDADLNDIHAGLDDIMAPYPIDKFGIVITSVVSDDDNNTTVDWSWSRGSKVSPHAQGSAYALPQSQVIEPNASIIVAEVVYEFTPTVGVYLTGGVTLDAIAVYRPRLADKVLKP